MTTVAAASRLSDVEVDERLRVWRERWRYAPDPVSRAHAQTAIDQWLDCKLELTADPVAIPAQELPLELLEYAVA
jgi:hypothetical protein